VPRLVALRLEPQYSTTVLPEDPLFPKA